MGEMNKFLTVGQDFLPSPGFRIKVQGKGGTVHTWWVEQFFDIFGKKGDNWHMILGDNPAGDTLVLMDFVLIELFQISHNSLTECTLQAKIFVKSYLKAIRDYSQYVEFPNMLYFYPTEGERLNFQACRETPLSPVPSLSGTS